MRTLEDYLLYPPAGSAAARAVQFGIDLTLTLRNLRLTPEERIRKLDSFIEGELRNRGRRSCVIHGSVFASNE